MTGAAGLTGGAVARQLEEAGHEVIGVVRRDGQRSAAGTTTVADLRDTRAMRAVLEGADACVHVAGIQLGEVLASAGARTRRLVVVSSAGIYSRHRASAATYERHEVALRDGAANCVIVRPTMIYGSIRDRNVHHVVALARRYRVLPIVGDGRSLIQPIHYEDLSEALAQLAAGTATGIVNAGGGAAITIRDAALAVFLAIGARPQLVSVPAGPAMTMARLVDAVRGSRWTERLERLAEDRSVDNARLIALTGRVPRDLPTGLRDMVRNERR